MKRSHQKAFLSICHAFRIWKGFVYWKRTSSSTWSSSRGVGWSFWKVSWLPWLILGSGTRINSVQISQRVGEALVQSSINVWQQLKCPPMKGVLCYYGLSVLCPPKFTGWRLDVPCDGIWRWRQCIMRELSLWKECMSYEKMRGGCESQPCEDSEKRTRKAAFSRHQMCWHFDRALPSLQKRAE